VPLASLDCLPWLWCERVDRQPQTIARLVMALN